MENLCNDVILCKGESSASDGDSYISACRESGYSCKVLTSLSFSFVNLEKLQDCLERPESYSGLIFTSQRSVEAVNQTILNKPLNDSWRKLAAYCVGPATETLAKNSLKLDNCIGSESGNAQELAKFIILNSRKSDKPLLYPCSGIARETIQRVLDDAKIKTEKIVAYETSPSDTLESDLLKIVNQTSQIFVFFSPSIVKYVSSVAEKHNLLDKIKPIAIGPVTAEALTSAGLRVYGVAAKPEPVALVQSIKDAQTNLRQ